MYPDEVVEALIDAAEAWKNAGNFTRAEATIRRVLAEHSGDDAVELAWPMLIEVWLAAGKDEQARDELARLSASRPSVAASTFTAELLEAHGDYETALEWAERAVIGWAGSMAGAVERMSRDPGPFAVMMSGVGIRAGLRASLGYEPDELDRLTSRARDAFAQQLDALAASHARSGPKEVRGLFWPRGALEEVARRWPTLVPAEVVESGRYWTDLEAQYTAVAAEARTTRVTIVPADPDALAALALEEKLPVEDNDLRWRHREAQRARKLAISWPPPRNGPCWCGSARKYKKCCGNPAIR